LGSCRYLTLYGGVLDLSIIQGPFSITKCQTLISRFATFASLYDTRHTTHTHLDAVRPREQQRGVAGPVQVRAEQARLRAALGPWDERDPLMRRAVVHLRTFPHSYSDAKVEIRDTKVWHFVIENGC
jgi:hypothetical protein